MSSFKPLVAVAAIAFLSAAAWAAANVAEGKKLYMSDKFRCYYCHGPNGEGGRGPSFKGIGGRYDKEAILERAAHNCPPTGACSPKELGAIVDFLRTL